MFFNKILHEKATLRSVVPDFNLAVLLTWIKFKGPGVFLHELNASLFDASVWNETFSVDNLPCDRTDKMSLRVEIFILLLQLKSKIFFLKTKVLLNIATFKSLTTRG